MKFALGNAQNIGARAQQQDAFGFTDPADAAFVEHGGFAAVLADGMGGMEHGDAAAHAAIKAFLEAYQSKRLNENVADALRRSILQANQSVYRLAREMGSAEDMGTTLIAAVLHERSLFWVSSGDSGVFLYREGEFTLLNAPHIYARELAAKAAAGAITREAAATHPERESLTSYLGMPELAEIDQNIRPFAIEQDDCVLLASDGLFKTLDDEGMRGAMRGTFQQRCDALVAAVLARQREGQDNVTVIAIGPDEGLDAAAFQPAPEMAAPAPRRGRKRLAWTLLLLVLAFGLAAAGYWRFRPAPRRPRPAREEKPLTGAKYDASKAPPDKKIEGDKGPARPDEFGAPAGQSPAASQTPGSPKK
jgi:PPM family protein phosphatase